MSSESKKSPAGDSGKIPVLPDGAIPAEFFESFEPISKTEVRIAGPDASLAEVLDAVADRAVAEVQGDYIRYLENAIIGVAALIAESNGVNGLHLNGNVATWGELRTGGKREQWLFDFDLALEELSKRIGKEEGDSCGLYGCVGVIEIVRAGDCSCHLHAPCGNCSDAAIQCSKCARPVI